MESTLICLGSILLCCNFSHAIFETNKLTNHIVPEEHEIPGLSLDTVDAYRKKWAYSKDRPDKGDLDNWTGRYFPEKSTEKSPTNPGKTERQKMMFAAINKDCDDGKTNLTVD
ncbi:hypothetical protein WDU94_008121 [Cyamophila willieti]